MTVAVILAGGSGSRIGGGKPLRTLGGLTLLERARRQAAGWSDRVAVAVREGHQVGEVTIAVIQDDPNIEGPLGGLATALRFAREGVASTVLTIPADMPFLPQNMFERLAIGIGDTGAAIASSGGNLHPVCGLWRVEALDLLPKYLASGRRSLKGFAEAIGYAIVEWSVEPIDPFFNINDADDLAAAELLLRA